MYVYIYIHDIELQLSAFVIAGSNYVWGSCSMQAMCGRLAVDITAHTKT